MFCRRLLSFASSLSTRAISSTACHRSDKSNLSEPPDPENVGFKKLYRSELVTPLKRGIDVLKNAGLNKGLAFSLCERQKLGIHGLLPPVFMSQEQQADLEMLRIRDQVEDIEKYITLDSLCDKNTKLFYRVLCDNLEELMPIVYTPTIGKVCQEFGKIFRHPKGIYITPNDDSVSKIYQILANSPSKTVKAIVVTDGERILGLGDLGANGMGIPIGKTSLYTALGRIRPEWCLPVTIDCGTNNQALREDPLYTGLRRTRVRGAEYDNLINMFMLAATKRFGSNVLIQFEDFASQNAHRLLNNYKHRFCVFNDDIQGTASVVVAGLLAATRVTKRPLSEEKLVFLGAGGAATGIADLCVRQMILEGTSEKEACSRIFLMDINGLVTNSRSEDLEDRHVKFAKALPEMDSLLELLRMVKPGVLIGASTTPGAFSETIIKDMCKWNARPVMFALSNPTSKAECTAEAAYRWSNGSVLFASGSPFADVQINGRVLKPGQGNNAYVFPGIALGVIVFEMRHIPDDLFLLAAQIVADSVSERSLYEFSRVYPHLNEIPEISVRIAVAVGEYGYKTGLATLHPKPDNMELFVRQQLYSTDYDELFVEENEWPVEDSKHGFPVPKLQRTSMDEE
ncbi:unnamed protein product [Caenorhabditis sp. 36 PRJEB53466]|nr:unnamed protein product [Caenorhabditis sp. 36 PRJEB53466]